jgi:hypothetical protein
MKKMLALKLVSILLLFSIGYASAAECPYRTTSTCVGWLQRHASTWADQNDTYWRYSGRLLPNNEMVDIKIKLLDTDSGEQHGDPNNTRPNRVHVMNIPGGQHYYLDARMEPRRAAIEHETSTNGSNTVVKQIVWFEFETLHRFPEGHEYVHTVELKVESERDPLTGRFGYRKRSTTLIDGRGTIR